MLLRQLYLAYYEERRFAKALEISRQSVELAVLPDVAHQDARPAPLEPSATSTPRPGHLRLAARTGPPKRRAFHFWTLGSLYFLAGRHDEAISALSRAARWGTTDKPLYQGHLCLRALRGGEPVDDLPDSSHQARRQCPQVRAMDSFVLGLNVAFYDRRWAKAPAALSRVVHRAQHRRATRRSRSRSPARSTLAQQTLARLPKA